VRKRKPWGLLQYDNGRSDQACARKLLGWERYKLAQRAKVHSSIIERAESVPGEPPISDYQKAFIREALRAAGLEFTNRGEPGVKLRR
jgi:hypothetical protein